MTSQPAFVELRARGAIGWVRADLASLGLETFWQPLEPLANAKGRGGVGVLRVPGIDLVVRPYRRGGALGRLLNDRYARPARARRELELLDALRNDGVPVVAPVAAVARRGRAFWRLRLCTELLPDALPVPAFLAAQPALRRYAMEAVGIVVRLAFAAGLHHPDLHLDNVLCSAAAASDAMLVRMQRYVVRHRQKLAAVPSRAETMRFLRALGLERSARHEAWRRLLEKLRRAVGRRKLAGR